jgi:hypothetical protein
MVRAGFLDESKIRDVPLTKGGWLDGFDRGQGERRSYRKALATSGLSIALPCLCVESALSPSSSQIIIHSLPSNTSYVDKVTFIRTLPLFLPFSPPPLGVDVLRLQSYHWASPLNSLTRV